MNVALSPSTIAPPAANYVHGVVTQNAGEWLHTSGVVPIAPDGTVPEALADQARVVWANIAAILAEGGMSPGDIVSVTTYVVAEQLGSLGSVMAARDAVMGDHRAASTLVTVPALVRSEWKMEIAVIAAR